MSHPRRIMVCGDMNADSFAENVAYTLREMGFAVLTPSVTSQNPYIYRLRSYSHLLRQKLTPRNYLPDREKWLLKTVKEHRPQLLLAITDCISEATLFELKKLGVEQRMVWWGDPPGNLARLDLLSQEWDAIFLKDKDAVKKFRLIKLNAHYMPEAINPAWHKPVATRANNSTVIAGNFYGYRQVLVKQLLKDGVELSLYGNGLPLWTLPEIKQHGIAKYIVKEEKSRVFGAALACLNTSTQREGNSLNCRAFEVAGAGGLQMMEFKPIVAEAFEPGKEILVFNEYEELLDLLARAKRSYAEMIPIRENGARRALAEHTYRHRLTAMLKVLNVEV